MMAVFTPLKDEGARQLMIRDLSRSRMSGDDDGKNKRSRWRSTGVGELLMPRSDLASS